jgi:hypothetical protein
MKARTKAQRRGRPRKSGQREPNGRLQRDPLAESIAATRAANIEARMAQYGLSLADAGSHFAGYEVGRLYLKGQIDLVDVEVCSDYVHTVARFMSLTNPQHPFPRAMDYLMTIKGQGGEPNPDQIARARKAYSEWVKPLEQCDSRARMTFHGIVFYDNHTGDRLDQLKECISALRRKFR